MKGIETEGRNLRLNSDRFFIHFPIPPFPRLAALLLPPLEKSSTRGRDRGAYRQTIAKELVSFTIYTTVQSWEGGGGIDLQWRPPTHTVPSFPHIVSHACYPQKNSEVASSMKKKNLTKDEWLDWIILLTYGNDLIPLPPQGSYDSLREICSLWRLSK
jgi:hypothetical protein